MAILFNPPLIVPARFVSEPKNPMFRPVLLLSLAAALSGFAQIPAFPGAEGFGANATGGRGGDVYVVTNLNSSGAGSLRYGVDNAPTTGRTIVFAVSGYIPISYNSDTGNQTLRVVKNKVTIAGQTAPGDGIGLKDGRILMTGNNCVIRNLRIRHGKNGGAGYCRGGGHLDSRALHESRRRVDPRGSRSRWCDDHHRTRGCGLRSHHRDHPHGWIPHVRQNPA